jgi:peptide/nickel transport system substrate-binding protein
VAKAKQLLEEAGYANGFEMPLYYFLGGVGTKECVEAITLYLNDIGIVCKPEGIEQAQIFQLIRKWSTETTAEVVMLGAPTAANWPDPTRSLQQFYWSKNPMGVFGDAELDAIIEKSIITMDDVERGKLIKEAFSRINDLMPTIQILSHVHVYSMQSNIDLKPTQKIHWVFFKDISAN